MKLSSHRVDRVGDKLTVRAQFRSQMRQPVALKLTTSPADPLDNDVLMSGDVREVSGALNAIAEIAWSQGWRPRGLMGMVARAIETYKEPPVQA